MTARLNHKFTLEEYLELDHNSEEKIEYYDGNVWTMSGASETHNTIVLNICAELRALFRGRGCRVFSSDMRVEVPTYLPYRYPDATALCGEPKIKKLGRQELLTNPELIVEVLSDSTEGFDRGDKFSYYKSIPSFVEYLLVSQKRAYVTQLVKQSENIWTNVEYTGLETNLKLHFADFSLKLSEIYRDVTFPPQIEVVRFEQ